MGLRRLVRWARRLGEMRRRSLRRGQLDNRELESLVGRLVEREKATLVVEVGTGGGKGSTVAIHRALAAGGRPFRLVGYEGDTDLAGQAERHWAEAPEVTVVNEYFMQRADLDVAVKPKIAPDDRVAYAPEFDAIAAAENFLSTPPPGPIDLLFIDSVRYTHLAILRAARPWLSSDTVVLMEDDIPGYGELAIVGSEFALRDVTRHEIAGHTWPLVEFRMMGPPGFEPGTNGL